MADEMAEWPQPATGYVMTHHSKHESRDAARADIPLEARDDRAAIAHVRAEVERIRISAPCNVEHRISLVHRTEDGPRAVFTAGPFRGAAPPL
jgi:hypothetical protein